MNGTSALTHSRRIVFRITAPNGISDPAGQAFHESVFAPRAITADKVGAAGNFREQSRNIDRIILQIAIDQNSDRAVRGLEPGIDRGALAAIFCKPNYANVRSLFDSLGRAIDRSIVDENNFMIDSR